MYINELHTGPMYYIVNDTKDNTPAKAKKKSVEELIMAIFKWLLCIEPPHTLNISGLIYHSLKWKKGIRNMNKSDINAVMLTVFKRKKSVAPGLYAIIEMIEMYEKKSISLIQQEKIAGVYKTTRIDDMIRLVIVIAKMDIKDAISALNPMVRDETISASAIFSIINITAVDAMQAGEKWDRYLAQNNLVKDIAYNNNIPIEDWLMDSGIGFDEKQYKTEQNQKKQLELNNKMNRQSIKNWAISINQNNNSNNSTITKRPTTRRTRPRRGGSKSILSDVTTALQVHRPNQKWDKSICAFYNHPEKECKHGSNLECPRNHICPFCSGAHKMSECPTISQ